MKLRMPAYPLIICDPYFNVWSFSDELNAGGTVHWCGKPNSIIGLLETGEKSLCFMGDAHGREKMKQKSVSVTALSTVYEFEYGEILLKATFTSPLLPNDTELLSRPVTYLYAEVSGVQNAVIKIEASEQLCLQEAGQYRVVTENVPNRFPLIRMGSAEQPVLKTAGDSICIDYGYFYLGTKNADAALYTKRTDAMTYVGCKVPVGTGKALFVFAYDDTASIEYFGKRCVSVWNKNGKSIVTAVNEAIDEYGSVKRRADEFDEKLFSDAEKAGGEMYAELLTAAFRQVMGAHKAVTGPDGELLWISKECSSNGCAATVDISYPSSPMFLYYNTELLRGMLRPVFRYVEKEGWQYDFAPHDVGTYPLLNGQTYYDSRLEYQMPIEECGNMLLLVSALALAEKKYDFFSEHKKTTDKWAEYLLENGFDPANQLCTDDFAGHLAHNCNLSLKAICALGAYARVCGITGDDKSERRYRAAAEKMADEWCEKAANTDGSYRLAFDRPDTYSMKYNLIWDKVLKLGLFDKKVSENEFKSYFARFNKYGLPLDNRAVYTKSDWLLWCACFAETQKDFEDFIRPLWLSYNETQSRAPLTDWYDTDTAKKQLFQNRTVQGGLWMRLLAESDIFQ